VINSGQTFPLTTQYPFGFSVERPVIVHRFGSLDAKQEQRYYAGIGPRKFQFKRPNLNWTNPPAQGVLGVHAGPWQAFTYNVPNPDGTTSAVLVTFEQAPISLEYLRNAAQVGLNLVEVVDPAAAPVYASPRPACGSPRADWPPRCFRRSKRSSRSFTSAPVRPLPLRSGRLSSPITLEISL